MNEKAITFGDNLTSDYYSHVAELDTYDLEMV